MNQILPNDSSYNSQHVGEINILDLATVLIRRKKLFFSIIITFFIIAIIALALQSNTYTSQLKIGQISRITSEYSLKKVYIDSYRDVVLDVNQKILPIAISKLKTAYPDIEIPDIELSLSKRKHILIITSKIKSFDEKIIAEFHTYLIELILRAHKQELIKTSNELKAMEPVYYELIKLNEVILPEAELSELAANMDKILASKKITQHNLYEIDKKLLLLKKTDYKKEYRLSKKKRKTYEKKIQKFEKKINQLEIKKVKLERNKVHLKLKNDLSDATEKRLRKKFEIKKIEFQIVENKAIIDQLKRDNTKQSSPTTLISGAVKNTFKLSLFSGGAFLALSMFLGTLFAFFVVFFSEFIDNYRKKSVSLFRSNG